MQKFTKKHRVESYDGEEETKCDKQYSMFFFFKVFFNEILTCFKLFTSVLNNNIIFVRLDFDDI